MAVTFTKTILSGSTQGKGIILDSTTSAATVHSTGTSSSVIDEVWIYAHNTNANAQEITIRYGGSTDPTNTIKVTVPSKAGLQLIVPGLVLTGTGSAANTITAIATTTANAVSIHGYVNRIG